MCLILVRNPEVKLEFDNIKHAVLNNPHGWGYVIPDRGKLEVRRFFSKKGTDPEEVYDVLDTHLDKQIFMHLRFCTAGEESKANVHPFPVLQQRKDGMQAWLMHNGTVSEYNRSKSPMSDTYHFTQEVVHPLLKRVMAYTGKKAAITDPFVNQVISKFANGWSKFVLIDQYGNYQIVGKGEQKEGYWVSNDYSFRPSYRAPAKTETTKTYSTTGYSYGGNYKNSYSDLYKDAVDAQYEDVRDQCASPFGGTTESSTNLPAKVDKPIQKLPEEEPITLDKRTKFLQLVGMESLDEMCSLTEEDILDMVNEYPEVMTVLIMDLLWELYNEQE